MMQPNRHCENAKRSWQSILFCGFLLVLLCSCTKSHESHPRDTLRVDLGSEPATLDPQLAEDISASRVLFDLFAGLVDFDQTNKVIPGLASSYDVSPDGKTYTFHLRHHLKFSNGLPITAHDFVYSWSRVVDPDTASPYGFLLDNVVNGAAIIHGKLPPEALGVSAPDRYTFVVHLVSPDPVFIRYCTRPNLMVVPENVIARYGADWTKPQHMVTSGAYTLKQHIVDGYILVQKNPHYYDAATVHIDRVKYIPYVDIHTALDAYKAGDIDVANVPLDATEQMKRTHTKELHIVHLEGVYYLDYNMKLPLFANNPKLRQALSMAIDRNVLVHDVLRQNQIPLYSFATSTIEGGKYSGLNYDWAKLTEDQRNTVAKQLYADSGYGPTNPLHITITYNTSELNKKVMLTIASMWEKSLGVKIDVKNRGWAVFIHERRAGDYVMARDGWLPDYDAITGYTILYQCNGIQNRSHYCNPDYDALIRVAEANPKATEKQILYSNALRLAENDYPIIPLFEYTYTRVVKPYVKGYNIDANYLDHVQSKWFSF